MIAALAGVFALAGFDAWFTARQFKKFGTKIELNNLVRWLANHVGIVQGTLAGVLTPTVIGGALLYHFGLEKTAVFWVGMRTTLFLHQLKFLVSFSKKAELLDKSS